MKHLLAAILLLAAGPASARDPGDCLHYGREPVRLAGEVVLRSFAGPPGYGETPKIDRKEVQALLRLSEAICVGADADDPAEAEQREITLIPMHGENLRRLRNRAVEVRGRLMHASTGHHHTPLLLVVDDISGSGTGTHRVDLPKR